MSNISAWSATDENNNNIPPNGFPEHQSPSSVNNSARALMGGVRRAYLEQPYFNPGGAIQYVNESTFSIKDTNEITDFSVFYRVGRRLKAVSVSGVIYGNVGAVSYTGGVTEVKCAWDSGNVLNSQVSAVYCGLAVEDAGEIVGRLPVGMILPYTAMSLPPGFLYADGKSFDPSIYTALAELWKTGDDTYLYGQEAVGGKYWPKTPDVRGQFPRYLDMGAGVDPDSETREIGSVQTDAIRNITGKINLTSAQGGEGDVTGVFTNSTTSNSGITGVGSSWKNVALDFDASSSVPTAEENRPTNMAFPALIVAWHGITPAENITIQDLLTAFSTMQGSIDQIYEAKDIALVELETEASQIYSSTSSQIQTLVESAETQIDNTTSEAVGTVNSTSQTAVANINTTAETAVDTVNTTTATAIASVEGKAEEITSAGDVQVARLEQEANDKIAIAQSWATGDIAARPEGSAKHWAESINPDNFAIKDLSNTSQLTNCILSTGCNIQLDWTDTTLTLKAGSKVIKPDGSYINVASDITYNVSNFSNNDSVLLVSDGRGIAGRYAKYSTSGSGAPSSVPSGSLYYDYTNKVIYNDVGEWGVSIPFAQVTVVNGTITEVVKLDTVSYMGACSFRLPMTVLFANGRNEDGTFKTIKKTFSDIYVRTAGFAGAGLKIIDVNGSVGGGNYSWDETLGYMVDPGLANVARCAYGYAAGSSSQITYMKPTGVVRLLTNADTEQFKQSFIPDYVNGIQFNANVNYTAPSDGIVVGATNITTSDTSVNIAVNGVTVLSSRIEGGISINRRLSENAVVGEGDVINISGINISNDNKFYPFKGVI